ncbi:type II toxin-antitoxin system VapB family antitoxin [Sandaracinobacteroides saxicola]|uniref:Type II toxin-antitoxin system VapB family antitoxin n=1 Tax=Sandaracinobacteroides saxicola TaxID=2759707 RepID=A0A7G5IJL1_9SPHN|nr:type II toxin-antitoxin system VapB family antitoxin [Sandaracinobacteroides saxicola]QMW23553.1 type II toxin-antitoxin system VapB family antitoxin [Sandaracinobacteroides saxicola]
MRTTVTLDDRLIERAAVYSGLKEKSAVINEALRSYVAWQAGLRLAALGGTMPDLEITPRKRPWDEFGADSEPFA